MNTRIFISKLRFDPALSIFHLRGWIDPIDEVSKIVFQVGSAETAAVLGTRCKNSMKVVLY